MSRMGVSGLMFLLVPAHPGRPGQRAVCVCVCFLCSDSFFTATLCDSLGGTSQIYLFLVFVMDLRCPNRTSFGDS